MKLKEIEATIKFTDEDGKFLGEIKAHDKYDEPETIEEFLGMKSYSREDKLRIILYGLNTINQTKLRQNQAMGKLAKQMFESKLFPSWDAAYKHLINLQNANALAREKANPAA